MAVYAFLVTLMGVVMSDRSNPSSHLPDVDIRSCFFFLLFRESMAEGIFYASHTNAAITVRIHARTSPSLFATDSGICASRSVAEGLCSTAVIYSSLSPFTPTSCTIRFNSVEYPFTDLIYPSLSSVSPTPPCRSSIHRSPDTGSSSLDIA